MLYGADVAVCSQINTKHINTVWTERTIVETHNQQSLNEGRWSFRYRMVSRPQLFTRGERRRTEIELGSNPCM